MHDDRLRDGTAFREQLACLREVSHLFNEDFDLDTALQGILDSARRLVSARCGFITVLDNQGQVRNIYNSGVNPEEDHNSRELPETMSTFASSGSFLEHLHSADLLEGPTPKYPAEFHLLPVDGEGKSLLASPVRYRGELLGAIYLVGKDSEEEFSQEDGQALFTLASHAAMAIANVRLETEVQQVQVELEATEDISSVDEMERIHTEFLGMVSHELRTPLTSIKGSVTTLQLRLSSLDLVEAREFLRIIDSQTDKMDVLISDLLDVARIETGTLSVAPEPTDVALLLEDAKNAFLSGASGNMLHISLPKGLPWVMADRLRIVQVLNNLVSNAATSSDEESSITVTAVRRGPQVEVSVSDIRDGVAAERIPHLFRRYPIANVEAGGSLPWEARSGTCHLQGNRGGPWGQDLGRERRTR